MSDQISAPISVNEARRLAKHLLSKVSDTPQLDADILIADAGNVGRELLQIKQDINLESRHVQRLNELLSRRLVGEPVAYLTRVKEFWSLPIRVTHSTLIPRPDTELLVERMLHRARFINSVNIADLGTGSGAVALAVASELPDAAVIGTDTSPAALEVAKDNACELGINNTRFIACDWATTLPTSHFNVIGSNPPYVKDDDPCLNDSPLKFEPREALSGGKDGLASIRRIVQSVKMNLKQSGWLIIEHGWDQGASVRQIMEENGYDSIETNLDLSGNERVTEGQLVVDLNC